MVTCLPCVLRKRAIRLPPGKGTFHCLFTLPIDSAASSANPSTISLLLVITASTVFPIAAAHLAVGCSTCSVDAPQILSIQAASTDKKFLYAGHIRRFHTPSDHNYSIAMSEATKTMFTTAGTSKIDRDCASRTRTPVSHRVAISSATQFRRP